MISRRTTHLIARECHEEILRTAHDQSTYLLPSSSTLDLFFFCVDDSNRKKVNNFKEE